MNSPSLREFASSSRIAACSASVAYGLMSFSVKDWRAKAGGLVGKGWVGELHSPGTSDCGTGRSSMGHIGSPVTRSKTNRKPNLVACATTSTFFPLCLTVSSFGATGKIVIPQIVMDQLVMPQPLAGAQRPARGANCQTGRSPCGSRRRNRSARFPGNVSDAALLIDRHLIPVVNAAHRFPGVRRPGVVAEFAGMRNYVERPHELARDERPRRECRRVWNRNWRRRRAAA